MMGLWRRLRAAVGLPVPYPGEGSGGYSVAASKPGDAGYITWPGYLDGKERLRQLDAMHAAFTIRQYAPGMHLRAITAMRREPLSLRVYRRWVCVGHPGEQATVDSGTAWCYWGYGNTPREAYWARLQKLMQRDFVSQSIQDAVHRHLFRRPVVKPASVAEQLSVLQQAQMFGWGSEASGWAGEAQRY